VSRRLATPIRTCVGCRLTDEQGNLVRVVADPAGRVKIDIPRRLPGRGAYIHPRRDCVAEAVRKGALARSLKRKLEAVGDEELWSRVQAGQVEGNQGSQGLIGEKKS